MTTQTVALTTMIALNSLLGKFVCILSKPPTQPTQISSTGPLMLKQNVDGLLLSRGIVIHKALAVTCSNYLMLSLCHMERATQCQRTHQL